MMASLNLSEEEDDKLEEPRDQLWNISYALENIPHPAQSAFLNKEAGEEGSEERNVPPQLGGNRYLVGEEVCWLWGP